MFKEKEDDIEVVPDTGEPVVTEAPEATNSQFVGDINWLSGRHMHEFLSQHSQGTTNIHRIIDQSGKTVTATWE